MKTSQPSETNPPKSALRIILTIAGIIGLIISWNQEHSRRRSLPHPDFRRHAREVKRKPVESE